jgi:hypothetical protein
MLYPWALAADLVVLYGVASVFFISSACASGFRYSRF